MMAAPSLPARMGLAALHLLPPERAHHLALMALKLGFISPGPALPDADRALLGTEIGGLRLAHPLGLAGGFDKNCVTPAALLGLGFSSVEIGGVTPLPQPGNPRPRLFRLAADRAIINRMGFNNDGARRIAERLARIHRPFPGKIGVNLGANKESAERIADYLAGLEIFWPIADFLTLNISSPNTPGLRALESGEGLQEFFARMGPVQAELARIHGRRPVFLKFSPDLTDSARAGIVTPLLRAGADSLIDGLILTNTTLDRPEGLRSARRGESGGLSGPPLRLRAREALMEMDSALEGRLPIIAAGGIDSGAEAWARIRAGASALQIYTALVYVGPAIIPAILRDLAARLRADGFTRLSDAIGIDRRFRPAAGFLPRPDLSIAPPGS